MLSRVSWIGVVCHAPECSAVLRRHGYGQEKARTRRAKGVIPEETITRAKADGSTSTIPPACWRLWDGEPSKKQRLLPWGRMSCTQSRCFLARCSIAVEHERCFFDGPSLLHRWDGCAVPLCRTEETSEVLADGINSTPLLGVYCAFANLFQHPRCEGSSGRVAH